MALLPLACSDREARQAYRARELEPGVWSATLPRMQLDVRFETGRISLLAADLARASVTPVDLTALTWGCEDALQAIPPVAPLPSAQRPGAIEYRHADFDEWYLPGPAGLEQGFTIRALPPCAQRGEPLQIRLALGDPAVTAELGAQGEALISAAGTRTIHYGEAFAKDASGKAVSVRVRTRPGLTLELDVQDARLPLIIDPLAWVEQQRLTANDGAASDFFGKALAASGDTLLVGAYGDDDQGIDSGSAYVFVRNGGTWSLQQKLLASDGASGDAFGYAVALSGDIALVGAHLADAPAADSGAAYVFTRNGNAWTQQAKLVPSDAAAGDHFASALAISGNVALLGAPFKKGESANEAGAAYTFLQNGALWSQQAKLVPSNNAGDHFGSGVALSGNKLALGTARGNGFTVGFYAFDGSSWLPVINLSSSSANLAYYGSALAMSSAYTVIGSYAHPFEPSSVNGSVLVVSNATHAQTATLRANDGSINDLFGRSVAISESNLILVGSPQDDDQGTDSGSAFVFTASGNGWTQQQKLLASDGQASDGFGSAVAITANTVFLGAPQSKTATGAGLVYTEGLGETGAACSAGKDCQSGFCVEGVCCASACSGACQSCLAKNKASGGGADGVCGSVKAETDPRDSCPESSSGSCGTTGLCDGKGACAIRALGTSCTFTACASATSSTLSSSCNGAGDCKP
ncbi:MAG TPA: FG-GAP repeat protein, partial [Polyangiaceae bacterium]|nr:FG-GAP repeat protein [Polyangiaceae bacterium]